MGVFMFITPSCSTSKNTVFLALVMLLDMMQNQWFLPWGVAKA